MPNPNILDEYLVRLGFDPDRVSAAQFTNLLRDVESQVNFRYLSMAKQVAGFQLATLGAFAAIGIGTLGFMDRVAQSDQAYRLFALHMYTSLPVARELKVALDALGQPLENVMWDPELAARFHQLVRDQQIMTEQLGPGFENNMRGIRDMHFEVTRFGVELQYLGMNIVQDLFQAFGKGTGDVLADLQHLNSWFIANIPYFAYWITTKLKPVLVDIRDVFKTIWDTISNVNFDTVATDVQKLVKALAQASEIMIHLVSGAIDLGEGKFKEAYGELQSTAKLITPGSGTVIGAVAGGAIAGVPGAIVGGAIGNLASKWGGTAYDMQTFAKPFAADLAKRLGIPANVIMSQWGYETGGFSHMAGSFNLAGIKDPATGKFQDFKSLSDFEERYGTVLDAYVRRAGGVAPQNVADFAQMLEGGSVKYAPDRTAAQYGAGMTAYITVNAKTNADANEIAQTIDRVLKESFKRPPQSRDLEVMRNLNESAGWSYGQ